MTTLTDQLATGEVQAADVIYLPDTQTNLSADIKPALSERKRKKIRQLLFRGEVAFGRGRLTEPFDDNAYFHYLNVLAIDPENSEALAGLDNIVESYLDRALDHVTRQELKSATDFLTKAKSVDANHPNIAAVEQRINQQRSMRSEKFTLSVNQLHARSDALSHRLMEIGRIMGRKNAQALIRAPSDAACRWIYQQLNAAEEKGISADYRYDDRAEVVIFYP